MSLPGPRQYAAILALAPLVVGGGPADQSYSFMGSMQPRGYAHYCGATLVKPQWMVTAAHCVTGVRVAGMRVRIGSSDRTSGGELIDVAQSLVHPTADLAVIKLASPSTMRPATIGGGSPGAGTAVRLLGWGQTCPQRGCAGRGPVGLKQLDTRIIDHSNCASLEEGELCVSGTTTSTACYGDSGGPALVRAGGEWELVGATSRGGDDNPTCGTGNAVYTDVTSYRSWIDSVTSDCSGSSTQGSLAGTGASQTLAPFTVAAGLHRACLDGPPGADFDLYLDRWDGSAWVTVSTSDSSGPDESIAYAGEAGTYRYRVASYRGGGTFTCATSHTLLTGN